MKNILLFSMLVALVFGLFITVGIGCSRSNNSSKDSLVLKYVEEKTKPNTCDFVGYHLEVGDDSTYLYDGDKLVAALAWKDTGKLDSVVIADNQ